MNSSANQSPHSNRRYPKPLMVFVGSDGWPPENYDSLKKRIEKMASDAEYINEEEISPPEQNKNDPIMLFGSHDATDTDE